MVVPVFSDIKFNILLQDENDNAPVFSSSIYNFAIAENLPPITEVGSFEATDSDLGSGGEIIFSLSGDPLNRYLATYMRN